MMPRLTLNRLRWPVLASGLLAALLAGSASAQGYVEINQALVDAAGGFPYVISTPGLYRLTGNLTKTSGGGSAHVIEVSADDVTLDLGGFTIGGPGSCSRNASTGAITCSGHLTGSGIHTASGLRVHVRNGRVTGFINGITTTSLNATFEDLLVSENAFAGLSTSGNGTVIQGVRAMRNGANGILASGNSTIRGCVASQNDDNGITAIVASSVTDSYALGNRLSGMSLSSDTLFNRNTVGDNFAADPIVSGVNGGFNFCTNSAGTPVGC